MAKFLSLLKQIYSVPGTDEPFLFQDVSCSLRRQDAAGAGSHQEEQNTSPAQSRVGLSRSEDRPVSIEFDVTARNPEA
jgi:hypothetical protein